VARLYADEDFSARVVAELRRLGHDVLTAQEDGLGGRKTPDDAILVSATTGGRPVLTFNRRHFIRFHRQGRAHAGILVCTRDTDVVALAARIHEAIAAQPVLENQLIRIIRPHRP
jgi:Domain of unknown function (DUF5615)